MVALRVQIVVFPLAINMDIFPYSEDNDVGGYVYFGQCDVLRRQPKGEGNWHAMMADKQEVSVDEFLVKCDVGQFFEDGESIHGFIADDPRSYFAKSHWGNEPVYFIATKGFEFIWRK